MSPDQRFGEAYLPVIQAVILRQFDSGLKPEFCFAIGMMDVDMQPCFLPGEEKEPESVFAEDGWA